MAKSFNHFGVIGAGAWGTALATVLVRAGRRVSLWAHQPQIATIINQQHENTVYLKGIALDHDLEAISDLKTMAGCDALIVATPAQHLREIVSALPESCLVPLIIAAKGIERNSAALMTQVAAEARPHNPLAIISGPSFAIEVARGLPTALTFAMRDPALGAALIKAMATPAFRLYETDDIVGVELGGAIKNVLAVACGIVSGRNLGDNARASLITRGIAEMMRLGTVLGGRSETLMGLSGVGDLVLTCSSLQSRNMSLGIALGQGQKLADILASRAQVTEGVTTASAAYQMAQKNNVDMPIVAAVDNVLNGANIDKVISELLARPLKHERA